MEKLDQADNGTVFLQGQKREKKERQILKDDTAMVDDLGFDEHSVIQIIDLSIFDVTVETFDDRKIVIKTRKSDTILDLMKNIRERVRVNDDEHRMYYSGTMLKLDTRTINQCGIHCWSTITIVESRKHEININVVMYNGERVAIVIMNNDTIIDIKKKINDITGVSIDDHILLFGGLILSNADKAVDEYKIAENSDIYVGIFISVKTIRGKILKFGVLRNDRIIDIKKKIRDEIGELPEIHQLEYRGEILAEDDATIHHYRIGNESVIGIVEGLREGIQLFAITMDRGAVSFYMKKNDTIIDVKKKIHDIIGLSPDESIIEYQDRSVKDFKTLAYYRICNFGVINVVDRLRCDIQIFAITFTGLKVGFKVTKYDTIIDIKKKIHEKIGLSPDEQKLVFQGGILEDCNTINDYAITENSVIHVVARLRNGIQIFIKTKERKKMMFEVMEHDRIIDIKKKIFEKIGISPDEHKLVYQGGILQDNNTVGECQIIENSVIVALHEFRNVMVVHVTITYNGEVILQVTNEDRISDIKNKIHTHIGLPPHEQILICNGQFLDNCDKSVLFYGIAALDVINVENRMRDGMQIFVTTMNGNTVALQATKCDRIIYLKKRIQRITELPSNVQTLLYHGRILKDYKTVNDYQIIEKSVINLVVRDKTWLFVRTINGGVTRIEVSKNDKIINVKKVIQDTLGVSQDKQRLIYEWGLLYDGFTLDDYYDIGNCVLDVMVVLRDGMRVFGRTIDGRRIFIEVTKNDTIIDMKKKIHEKIGISPDEQQLVFQGGILDDDKTVDEYGIVESSVITVVARLRGGMLVFAKTMDGKTVAFEVRENDTIIDIKKKIQYKIGLSPNEQKLIYQGGILEDDKTVDEYQIAEKSVINVVARLRRGTMQIFVRTIDNWTVILYVCNSDKIIDIKKKIHEKIGLSLDEQKLIYQGVILEDDKTVDTYGMVEKSVIEIKSILRRDIQIFVRTNNRTDILRVSNCDTIIDIKKKIHIEIGISPDVQIIKCNGTILRNDNSRLYECVIAINCHIDVSVALKINITILTHNMETVRLEVLNIDRIIDIKKKIHEKIGLPSDEQQLEYLDTIQSDDISVCPFVIDGNNEVTVLESKKLKTRGICLVISNENFTNGGKTRRGTRLDEADIEATFEPMGYEIQIYRDVTNADMNTVLDDTKNLVEGSHKMLVVFILSHGEETGVVTVDGAVIPYKDIWKPFMNDNFPALAGKPKIFFFVCCRGNIENRGVPVASSSLVEHDGPTITNPSCPTMADLFMGYATCPGYVSCRTPLEGTFYVKTLCEVIRNHRLWTVAEIHQEVQIILSRRGISNGDYFQMPYYENVLSNRVYFVEVDLE